MHNLLVIGVHWAFHNLPRQTLPGCQHSTVLQTKAWSKGLKMNWEEGTEPHSLSLFDVLGNLRKNPSWQSRNSKLTINQSETNRGGGLLGWKFRVDALLEFNVCLSNEPPFWLLWRFPFLNSGSGWASGQPAMVKGMTLGTDAVWKWIAFPEFVRGSMISFTSLPLIFTLEILILNCSCLNLWHSGAVWLLCLLHMKQCTILNHNFSQLFIGHSTPFLITHVNWETRTHMQVHKSKIKITQWKTQIAQGHMQENIAAACPKTAEKTPMFQHLCHDFDPLLALFSWCAWFSSPLSPVTLSSIVLISLLTRMMQTPPNQEQNLQSNWQRLLPQKVCQSQHKGLLEQLPKAEKTEKDSAASVEGKKFSTAALLHHPNVTNDKDLHKPLQGRRAPARKFEKESNFSNETELIWKEVPVSLCVHSPKFDASDGCSLMFHFTHKSDCHCHNLTVVAAPTSCADLFFVSHPWLSQWIGHPWLANNCVRQCRTGWKEKKHVSQLHSCFSLIIGSFLLQTGAAACFVVSSAVKGHDPSISSMQIFHKETCFFFHLNVKWQIRCHPQSHQCPKFQERQSDWSCWEAC